MRDASTSCEPISIVRHVPNGNPSCDTSSGCDSRQDVARPRAPEPDRRPGGRHVDERGGAVRRQPVREQLAVGHAVGAAGDDPELVLAQPHDREVGLEAAARAQHGCVDDPSNGDVHLREHRALQGVERSGALHVEDRERGQIEDPGVLSHRQVLGIDDRRPPAGIPFGVARLDAVALHERRVRLVPLRPFPPDCLVEHRAERLLPRVHGREPDPALARPLLGRMDDPVRLRERLEGACLDVRARLLMGVEAADVGRVQVDVRLAVHHPLGDRLPDARALPSPRPPLPTRGP